VGQRVFNDLRGGAPDEENGLVGCDRDNGVLDRRRILEGLAIIEVGGVRRLSDDPGGLSANLAQPLLRLEACEPRDLVAVLPDIDLAL